MRQAGRHFLQIPGPTNVPDRILRAIDRADERLIGPNGPVRLGQKAYRVLLSLVADVAAWLIAPRTTLDLADVADNLFRPLSVAALAAFDAATERVLSITQTCRQHDRNLLGYLTGALTAHRHAYPAPILPPDGEPQP